MGRDREQWGRTGSSRERQGAVGRGREQWGGAGSSGEGQGAVGRDRRHIPALPLPPLG